MNVERAMRERYDELSERLAEIADLQAAASVLYWDQATYLPPKGAAGRGRSMAALSKVVHQKFTDDRVGTLLEMLTPWAAAQNDNEAAVIRCVQRRYDRSVRLPADYSGRVAAHRSLAYQAWQEARPANDFNSLIPILEKTLELSQEYASYFPECEHPADPFIDGPDPGMSTESIRTAFAELRAELVPLVDAFCASSTRDDSVLHQAFDTDRQLAFSRRVAKQLGFDFDRGRMDLTAHPFMTNFGLDDVRITTRVDPEFFGDCLYSTIHETGHAMYEQGVSRSLERSPLCGGTSMGVHESQSRLWENMVGRSQEFWEYWLEPARSEFPQLGDISPAGMFAAVNAAKRSQIRTEADELTYNLHIMIRFDLEVAMLEGKLVIRDLRDAWNARYESDLGLTPDSDANGVLQDVHWFHGHIGGMFQGYTLGNIMAAQFYETALARHPEIPQQITRGEYGTLHGFLRSEIYQHGETFLPDELLPRVTGRALSTGPYMRYLRSKFSC
jgi:carboxypeptidase Taq